MLANADGGADEPEDKRQFNIVLPCRQVMNDLFRHCYSLPRSLPAMIFKLLHVSRKPPHVRPVGQYHRRLGSGDCDPGAGWSDDPHRLRGIVDYGPLLRKGNGDDEIPRRRDHPGADIDDIHVDLGRQRSVVRVSREGAGQHSRLLREIQEAVVVPCGDRSGAGDSPPDTPVSWRIGGRIFSYCAS